jgi:hypothetical protein
LEFRGSSVPQDAHSSPVAVNRPPLLSTTSVSCHRCSVLSGISPCHLRREVLKPSISSNSRRLSPFSPLLSSKWTASTYVGEPVVPAAAGWVSAVITQTVAARRGSARGIRMFQGVSTRPLRCLRALRSRPPLQPRYETTSCSESVIDYVLRRLNDIGVDAIFGVAGDFAFIFKTPSSTTRGSTGSGAATSSTLSRPAHFARLGPRRIGHLMRADQRQRGRQRNHEKAHSRSISRASRGYSRYARAW